MKKAVLAAITTTLVFVLCMQCQPQERDEEATVNMPVETRTIGSIDLKPREFFWMIKPWKEGKLATIDGWGRFSEISFSGENRVTISPLLEFPRAEMDGNLYTWPQADVMVAKTRKMFHIAHFGTGNTKSFIPFLSWLYEEYTPVMLDADTGVVLFDYGPKETGIDVSRHVIYNYKEDREIYKTSNDTDVFVEVPVNSEFVLSRTYIRGASRQIEDIDFYFYDWRNKEKTRNTLTEKMRKLRFSDTLFRPGHNIDLGRRLIVGRVPDNNPGNLAKLSWGEDYEDTTVTPLAHLEPEGKKVGDFSFSADGNWATSTLRPYRGLYGEWLYKRVFFHMDGRYPGGISFPVLTDGYEQLSDSRYGAFVQHPVYGMCYAQPWEKKEDGKDVGYLRLYKMNDVLEEINRELLGKANELVR